MEYKVNPSAAAVQYLNGFETRLRSVLAERLKEEQFGRLSVSLGLLLTEGKASYQLESNESFALSGSQALTNVVREMLDRAEAEFGACLSAGQMLRVSLVYSQRAEEAKPSQEETPVFIPQEPRYRFDQIILPEELRKEIFAALNVIDQQELIYRTWGFEEIDPIPRSVLNFWGPPGTGKTMCAHAIAHKQGRKLLALNYAEIESKYVGDAPKKLMSAFDAARQMDCVLFFDEADSFLGKRIQNVQQGADQALNSLRSQMLILLEEFSGIVIFATNLVTNFDRAFESRILKSLKFEMPNAEARTEIIRHLLPPRLPLTSPLTDDEWTELGALTEGLSGRELKSAVLETLLTKASESGGDSHFSFEDFKQGFVRKQEAIKQLREEEKRELKEKILKAVERKSEEARLEAEAQQTEGAAAHDESAEGASSEPDAAESASLDSAVNAPTEASPSVPTEG